MCRPTYIRNFYVNPFTQQIYMQYLLSTRYHSQNDCTFHCYVIPAQLNITKTNPVLTSLLVSSLYSSSQSLTWKDLFCQILYFKIISSNQCAVLITNYFLNSVLIPIIGVYVFLRALGRIFFFLSRPLNTHFTTL